MQEERRFERLVVVEAIAGGYPMCRDESRKQCGKTILTGIGRRSRCGYVHDSEGVAQPHSGIQQVVDLKRGNIVGRLDRIRVLVVIDQLARERPLWFWDQSLNSQSDRIEALVGSDDAPIATLEAVDQPC